MKKAHHQALILAACVLLAFVLGLSLGRAHRPPVAVTATTRVPQTQTEAFTMLVNINTASAQQLAVLPGIGDTYAQRIVDYREANGPFGTAEELMQVDGIGPSRLEAILDYITVGGQP